MQLFMNSFNRFLLAFGLKTKRPPCSFKKSFLACFCLLYLTSCIKLTGESLHFKTSRSISEWGACNGANTDSRNAVHEAFNSAKDNAFVLIIDCPIFVHIGMDIAKPIFIDNGTSVRFSGNGKIVVDNQFVPAFVIANSADVELTNWIIEYRSTNSVNPYSTHFFQNGQLITQSTNRFLPQSNEFLDKTFRLWLVENRGIRFKGASSLWSVPSSVSAIFYFRGDTNNVRVFGLNLFVGKNTDGNGFIPTAFSFNVGPRNNKVILQSTPKTIEEYATPSNIHFTDIKIDGALMGWQGSLQNSSFNKIRSFRYADLQDALGENIGGLNKWFPPPHLFYLNYDPEIDYALFTRNVVINDVIDYGYRVGVARDKGAGDSISGDARSLKIGGVNILVDGYESYRPDGFLDLLTSENATIKNVRGSFDSSFVNYVLPALRFPGPNGPALPRYKNITLINFELTDLAANVKIAPLSPWPSSDNEFDLRNIVFILNSAPINTSSFFKNDSGIKFRYKH